MNRAQCRIKAQRPKLRSFVPRALTCNTLKTFWRNLMKILQTKTPTSREYLAGLKDAKVGVHAERPMSSSVRDRSLDLIQAQGVCTTTYLEANLGVTRQTAGCHLRTLRADGKIHRGQDYVIGNALPCNTWVYVGEGTSDTEDFEEVLAAQHLELNHKSSMPPNYVPPYK